jgi:RHS repeat-associated protein
VATENPQSAMLNRPDAPQCASLAVAACLPSLAVATTAAGDTTGYTLYTPEMQLLAETAVTAAASKPVAYSYLWFAGLPVASVEAATNTTRWYATDHLGTPFLMTDASGAVVWRAEYDPYGSVYAFRTGVTLHQPLRFPGQIAQDGVEPRYNVFRWYRSDWGRYTQSDPLGLGAGSNVYYYVSDNPHVYTDPTGLVKVNQTYTRRGGIFGGGGEYSLQFSRTSATGSCVKCGTGYQVRLTLNFDHGYLCTGSTACYREQQHANIASAFIAKAAQEWNQYEKTTYHDESVCKGVAQFRATDLASHITDGSRWPSKLVRDFVDAENDYEKTHHGFWCGWMSVPCSSGPLQ